jgi:hypothetical protein
MWVVILVAQSRDAAYRAQTLLQEKDILVRIRTVGLTGSFYEILVPEDNIETAQKVLIESEF